MTKPELRTVYRKKRKEFSAQEAHEISLRIFENLKSMPVWENSSFHIFTPILNQNEVNTLPVIEYLFEQKKQVIVPKIDGNKMLNCLIDKNTEFESGKFNVPEPKYFQLFDPAKIDVVFLPMLICDKSGNRVGYGGGFYDRWLSGFEKMPLKVGLNFFSPVEKIEDINDYDIPLDYCVTPFEIVSFSS